MVGWNDNQTRGPTAAKLVAIIALSIILVAVIAVQFGGGNGASIAFRNLNPASAATGNHRAAEISVSGVSPREAKWPKIARSEVLLHDPFQLPILLKRLAGVEGQTARKEGITKAAWEPAQRPSQVAFVDSLRLKGVDMVLMTPRGRVARIGGLSMREGDLLEGLRVVEIHSRGIVLKKEKPGTAAGAEQDRERIQPEAMDASRVFGWFQGQLGRMIEEASAAAGVED